MTEENEKILVIKEEKISLPKEVIKKLDIHNGDKLSYYFDELENEPTSIVLTKYGAIETMENGAQKKKKELEEAAKFSIDRDIDIIMGNTQEYWLDKLEKTIPPEHEIYYVKKVDNHLEIGIAKVDFVR